MIKVVFTPKEYKLEVTGHAGAGAHGADIVCAAASMLFYTLAESLKQSEDMLKAYEVQEEPGNGCINCSPKEEYEGNIQRSYWTILNGYQLLMDTYPGKVVLEIKK